MCLMIFKNIKTEFNKEEIQKMYTNNPDGLGIMFAENGQLNQKKILPKNAKEAYDFYLENARGKQCAIHFRLKTHGDIDLENAHPYSVTKHIGLMHNGVIEIDRVNHRFSDTWHFIENYLKPLSALNGYLMSQSFLKHIEEKLGETNKFIIADNLGNFNIINYDKGIKYKDSWFSNNKFITA